MRNEHTLACLLATTRYIAEMLTFAARYPQACQACLGWGGHTWSYDPSPAGVSLGSGFLIDGEPCAACEGSEDLPTCALCGQICQEDGTRLCTCPPNAGLPEGPECLCWYGDDNDSKEDAGGDKTNCTGDHA
jgi:hypothetical protein